MPSERNKLSAGIFLYSVMPQALKSFKSYAADAKRLRVLPAVIFF